MLSHKNQKKQRNFKQIQKCRVNKKFLEKKNVYKTKCCFILDYETYVKKDFCRLPGNVYYVISVRGKVNGKYKYVCVDKFALKVMVWQAICGCA
jgi:hypothetical protein